MKFNFDALNNSELKIRKYWRYLFFVINVLMLMSFIAIVIFSFSESTSENFAEYLGENTVNFIFYLIFSYIFYRCIYTKAGNRLLTLYLYLKPIHFLLMGLLIFYLPFPFNITVIGSLLIGYVVFYVLSWKLRKINKKLHMTAIYPEEYETLSHALSHAQTLDELKDIYSSLVQQWPKYEKKSTTLYNKFLAKTKM